VPIETIPLDQGMVAVIVQRVDITDEDLDTVFWTNLIVGCALTISGLVLSNPLGVLLSDERVSPIIRALSIVFLISSAGNVQMALLRRQMDFRSLAIRTMIAKAFGGLVGVTLAIAGYGVWSLVWQALTYSSINTIALWKMSDWRPRLRFSFDRLHHLSRFSISILGARFVNYIDKYSDRLLIGVFLGTTMLGYYSIAVKTYAMVEEVFQGSSYQVVFATLSKFQGSMDKIKTTFRKIISVSSILIVPLFTGLAVLAPLLVPSLYGAKWETSVPLLQIMALGGIPLNIFVFSGNLAIALGKPSWHFKLRVLVALTRFLCMAIAIGALGWGINGVVAASAIVSYLVYMPLNALLTRRLTSIQLSDQFTPLLLPVGASMVMALCLVAGTHLLASANSSLFGIGLISLLGGLIYICMIWIFRPDMVRDLIRFSRLALVRSK